MRQTPRERAEDLERAGLSAWGTLAIETKGRDRWEEPDQLRTAFQLDRDRILRADWFHRLRDKARLLLSRPGERYPVRVTHTLEIARAARLMARGLRVNEDLAEAIALGHDIGHAPFGWAGERALAEAVGAFTHHEQSVRVVERLEGGNGLNLTWEVRDGILQHTRGGARPATLEGQVAEIAGRVTWLSRELDDAVRAGACSHRDVPNGVLATLGAEHDERLARLVQLVVEHSTDQPEITLPAHAESVCDDLEALLARLVRRAPSVVAEETRAMHCVASLAVFYLENPDLLPAPYERDVTGVADFLAHMTDAEVLADFHRRFVPGLATPAPAETP